MNQDIQVRLEALKLIKDWSAGLIVVQSGAIAVVGALLKAVPTGLNLALVLALLLLLIASIYMGAVSVIGTVPYIVQNLPKDPQCDIYAQSGGIAKGPLGTLTLGRLCLLQAHLFVGSLLLFGLFAVFGQPTGPDRVAIEQPTRVQTAHDSTRK